MHSRRPSIPRNHEHGKLENMAKQLTEAEKARMRNLTDRYDLTRDDFFMHKHFIIITRSGIEKIQAKEGIIVTFEVEKLERDFVVIKAIALKEDVRQEYFGDEIMVQTYGEAGPENCKNTYYVMTAEKRALSRAVLKMVGLYQENVYGADEGVQDE